MGWSSGSSLFDDVIQILKDKVEDIPLREEIYMQMIPAFEGADCDTLDECMGRDIAFDSVFKKLNPELDDYWNEHSEEEDEYDTED